MYVWLSATYNETIFLRQRHNDTRWVVDCSPVILASDAYNTASSANMSPTVTMRGCFLYIASLALPQGPVYNQLSSEQWVCNKNLE
ncbi:unnamed protein product [Penicillium salamii]|uniref:Uncharacterized protein n=1 Tax=Penicillium salamii TaxID=1612424 RepID=A0A9W4JJ52_9EURO|nr:unnamed protein product [Penicillium salamii]